MCGSQRQGSRFGVGDDIAAGESHGGRPASRDGWWRSAVIYQIYPRSFADANGDGIGDLAGVRAHLDYLADLGIDAIWFSPWYASPQADAGYDVADYRAIDPLFGTLAEAETLIDEAHHLGIRIIIDVVPNHSSDASAWFREALAAGPGVAARELFWFRPGRGADGSLPPNNWQSIFGGPAWTRTNNPDGTPGEWYLHLFAAEQPDLNWDNPKVREEFEDVLRFWFDRGADGVRIDSAAMLTKDPTFADFDADDRRSRIRSLTGTRSTTSTEPGARSPIPTRNPARSSARCGCPTRSGSRHTCVRTRSTPHSTSRSLAAPGMRRHFVRSSTRRTYTRRSTRRRPGCCQP